MYADLIATCNCRGLEVVAVEVRYKHASLIPALYHFHKEKQRPA